MSALVPVQISVTDPIKTSNFISYKIHSSTARTGFASGNRTVDRRYNDFSWLAEALSKEFPGVIVPPLPEKQTIGRFSSEFVEARRRALEKFLERVAAHHELGTSASFVAFLQETEEAQLKDFISRLKLQSKSSGGGWLDSVSLTSSKSELEKTAADIRVEEVAAYIAQLEKQMASITKNGEALIKKNRELGKALFQFGQGFTWLGQSEGDALGAALIEMGSTADGLSNAVAAHADAESLRFVEPVDEYARMLSCIKLAIKQRQQKKAQYLDAITDVEAKQASYAKLVGVPGKEGQAAQKEQAVQLAQEAAENCKKEFEVVSARLLTEFELFKNLKAVDIKDIIASYVSLQIEYHKKCELLWSGVIPKIEAIVVDSPDDMRAALYAKAIAAAAPTAAASSPSQQQKRPSATTASSSTAAADAQSNNPFGTAAAANGSNFADVSVEDDDDEEGDVMGV